MFLGKLNYSRSLLAIVMGVPFPTEFFVDDAFAILAVRHELFFDSRNESKAICFLPIPTSSFTKGPDYTIAIGVNIRLKVLELIVYINLLAVNNYLFHTIQQLGK